MGSSPFFTAEHSSSEVLPWLKTLPLAPEYHPTIQEFQDPISYIFKIEKEASKFGICKIVPPIPPQSKKLIISNLNLSFQSLSHNSQNPTFTTREQQIGFCPRKQRPIEKSVWQSGEFYTLQEFEAKAKIFEKNFLKNRGKKTILPLEVETLYWKANGDRPFSVEYANDMPGSGFVPLKDTLGSGSPSNVGVSAWNMRGVARAKGSLLRFMKDDIPGVTSPMVYVAMMFSWFAWHVEDHDLHSLNYLHMGAGKTWYGVPKDGANAFEEVIRVHGFGEEINPLVTFATLGEKTTVMSPEVLINAGVPCCRLVQNAGEFVVTFPRAYHCGFSHGFNCGEASNIATPEWLKFAKDAAIRRASINYPPMVSHFQLLYDLALSICSRVSTGSDSEPRSSRLKDKKKGEGEMLVKQMFVQDVMQNNELLHTLGQGSEVVLLPHNSAEKFVWSNLRVGSKYKVKPGLPFSLYSSEESIKPSDDIMLARDFKQKKAIYSVKTKSSSMFNSVNEIEDSENEKGGSGNGDGLSDRGLFSCVKCGIWTFACVAIVQPTESTAKFLMSSDCSFLDWNSGESNQRIDAIDVDGPDSFSGSMEKYYVDNLDQSTNDTSKMISNALETTKVDSIKNNSSALNLLAMTYGSSSESDEEDIQPTVISEDNSSNNISWGHKFQQHDSISPNLSQKSSRSEYEDENLSKRFNIDDDNDYDDECGTHKCSSGFAEENDTLTSEKNYSPRDTGKIGCGTDSVGKSNRFGQRCDEDSSRMHVFCLEHAVEVEKQLRSVGGVHILLLCHPDYPTVETEAKKVAKELEMAYIWKDISFSSATKDDEERIQMALQSEDATPKNGDWAVKLGINLFYSAILSRSPLYNKQMPYNSVIYNAFGFTSPSKLPKTRVHGKGFGRQKKLVMAGKWCGKVWMSNQVHPLLLHRDSSEEEGVFNPCVKFDEQVGRKMETNQKVQTPSFTNKKVGKKRKSMPKSKIAKKMKFDGSEITGFGREDLGNNEKPEFNVRRSVRKRLQNQEDEIHGSLSENSEEDIRSPRGPLRSARILKRGAKRIVNSDDNDDDSPHDRSHQHGLRSCNRKVNSGLKSTTRKVKPGSKEIVDSGSESQPCDESEHEEDVRNVTSLRSSQRRVPLYKRFEEYFEMDIGPSTRMRKGFSRATQERETKPMGKRQVHSLTKGKNVELSVANNVGPTRKGPKMRLPVTRSPAMKGPKMRLPITRGPAMKGPKMRLPITRGPAMKGLGPSKKSPSFSIVDENVEEEEEEEEREKDEFEEEEEEETEFKCDIEGCSMGFGSKQELTIHKRNICPVEGCGKKFFSHKYLMQHRRVHMDDRPLKCPWRGCRMTFKWAWARTEHIRVHTGARPYVCNEVGCGQTFRFVSDFSRHKRKTGHSAKKNKK